MARCIVCDWTGVPPEGAKGCPQCGDTGIPSDPAKDINIVINTHELRVLSLWAERWAKHIEGEAPQASKQVRGIMHRLMRENAKALDGVALSIWDEINALREKYGNVEVYDASGKRMEPGGL